MEPATVSIESRRCWVIDLAHTVNVFRVRGQATAKGCGIQIKMAFIKVAQHLLECRVERDLLLGCEAPALVEEQMGIKVLDQDGQLNVGAVLAEDDALVEEGEEVHPILGIALGEDDTDAITREQVTSEMAAERARYEEKIDMLERRFFGRVRAWAGGGACVGGWRVVGG